VRADFLTEGGKEETTRVVNAASHPVRDQSFANGLTVKAGVEKEPARKRRSSFSTFGNLAKQQAESDSQDPVKKSRRSSFGSPLGQQSVLLARGSFARPSIGLAQPGAVFPATCLQFTNHMSRLRAVCKASGLELVYHFTKPALLPLILKTGFRMSTQGQGDGGVYFSTLGPAAYALGTDSYEENIIVDCFGPERLDEYKDKGMLDLCLVYGAEAAVLSQAPGSDEQDGDQLFFKWFF
jgi:hypothetical protein